MLEAVNFAPFLLLLLYLSFYCFIFSFVVVHVFLLPNFCLIVIIFDVVAVVKIETWNNLWENEDTESGAKDQKRLQDESNVADDVVCRVWRLYIHNLYLHPAHLLVIISVLLLNTSRDEISHSMRHHRVSVWVCVCIRKFSHYICTVPIYRTV